MADTRSLHDHLDAFLGAGRWVSLLVWGALLLAVYALHELFFVVFATFLLSFIVRRIVVGLAARLRSEGESPTLERWLTLGTFAAIVLVVWVMFSVLGARFVEQGHLLVTKAQKLSAADTLDGILSRTVGAYLFHRSYGGPDDPRYEKALSDYQAQNRQGEGTFAAFAQLQSDLEIGFELEYDRAEWQRLRTELPRGGATMDQFDRWFLTVKAPLLFAQQRDAYLARWSAAVDEPTAGGAAGDQQDSSNANKDRDRQIALMILADVKADSEKLAGLEREWQSAIVARAWQQFVATPEYREAFKQYFERRRRKAPTALPFDYPTFVNLREAHREGKQAFQKAFQKHVAAEQKLGRAQQQRDFEEAMRGELARHWWNFNSAALSLRAHLGRDATGVIEAVAARVEEAMRHLVSIPAQLVTSLLLTLFITLDMSGLKQGAKRLSTSRIAPLYHEVVPGLLVFGRLLGRSFSAQALIAVCNTLLTFAMLWALNIANELLLCGIVFFASFIPVVGVFIAGIPIVLQALMQPGGSMTLALIAVAGILLIHLLEATVLSPRIVGKVLHLHPVLILVIIVIGENLFGIWGLLLGVPVVVYILRFALLNESIPGIWEPEPAPRGSVASAAPESNEMT